MSLFFFFLFLFFFGHGSPSENNSGDSDVPSPMICQYLCHPLPPPPDSVDLSPPPPPPPPARIPGYSQGKCPPNSGSQCCQQYAPPLSPPYAIYSPYGIGNRAFSLSHVPIFAYLVVFMLFFSALLI